MGRGPLKKYVLPHNLQCGPLLDCVIKIFITVIIIIMLRVCHGDAGLGNNEFNYIKKKKKGGGSIFTLVSLQLSSQSAFHIKNGFP